MRSPLNELFELWLVSLRSLASGLEGCTTGDEQSLLATIATMSRERFARSSCYIISGISGSGKTSLGLELERRGFRKIPNVVTRPRRPEERDSDCVFVDEEEFYRMWRGEELATVRKTNGVWHGFRWSDVERIALRHECLYTDKSVPSAMELVKLLPSGAWRGVYLLPPSFQDLAKRISRREARCAQEASRSLNAQDIAKRFYEEIPEMAQSLALPYAYCINRSIEELASEVVRRF